MERARRIYIYLVSGIGLGTLAVGSISIIGTFLVTLRLGSADLLANGDVQRDEISRALALVVIGLPVWAFHWRLACRDASGDGPAATLERTSATRAAYFVIVGWVSLAVIVRSALPIAGLFIGQALGSQPTTDGSVIGAGPGLLVAGAIWTYHVLQASVELRTGPRRGAAAWLPRLYRHVAAWITLMVALVGAAGLVSTMGQMLTGDGDLSESGWWRSPLGTALAAIVVGGSLWWIHWRSGDRVIADAALMGADERTTRLRATYFGAVLLPAVLVGCWALAASTTTLVRWLLGASYGSSPRGLFEDIVGPLLTAVPFLVAALLHQRRRVHELADVSWPAVADAQRLANRTVAFIGLVFLAAGAVQVLRMLLEVRVDSTSALLAPDPGTGSLAITLGLVVAGLVVWAPAWASALRARASDPLAEARASVSAGYLFLVIGAASLALIPTGVFLLYRALVGILGSSGGSFADVAWPLAVAIVAAAVGGSHTWLMLADRRLVAETTMEPDSGTPSSLPMARTGFDIVVHVTGDGDQAHVLESLRRAVGSGVTVDVVGDRVGDGVVPAVIAAGIP